MKKNLFADIEHIVQDYDPWEKENRELSLA